MIKSVSILHPRLVEAAAELTVAELVEAFVACRVRRSCVELVEAFIGLEEMGCIVINACL